MDPDSEELRIADPAAAGHPQEKPAETRKEEPAEEQGDDLTIGS
jgi:hypothetical protein